MQEQTLSDPDNARSRKLHKRYPQSQSHSYSSPTPDQQPFARNPLSTLRSRAKSNPADSQPGEQQEQPRIPTIPSLGTGSRPSVDSQRSAGVNRSHEQAVIGQYKLDSQYPTFTTDLLGQRFDSAAILSNLNDVAYNADHPPPPPSSQYPAPPPQLLQQHSDLTGIRPRPQVHASESGTALASPNSDLVQSLAATGRQMEDIPQRRGDPGVKSPGARYSDEPKEGRTRKKTGFSSFMNNLVGAPKKPMISAPENPVHVTHVGYDQETGEFTVGVAVRLTWQRSSLTYATRDYLANGSAHCKPMESRSKNSSRIHRQSSTSSPSGMRTIAPLATTTPSTSSTTQSPTMAIRRNCHPTKVACRRAVLDKASMDSMG